VTAPASITFYYSGADKSTGSVVMFSSKNFKQVIWLHGTLAQGHTAAVSWLSALMMEALLVMSPYT
jgi:hypothetical protein